ncbi:MAG TPA: hypothetical protein VHV49_15655 [Pseudonocardiaceae bacterium]|jgi:hypothetical protein|nr:hypothetical protein [Pseudonocardiaceae bacterium]
MTSGFSADPGVLDGVAGMLRGGADALDDLAGSLPGVPNAGPVSGDMTIAVARQLAAAGEYAIGVAAAGQAVAEGGKAYQETDDAAKRSLPKPK